MSIASEITRLQNAKAALKESIEAKGVTVEDSAKLDEYSVLVDSIEQGNSKVPSIYDDVIFIDYDGTLLYTYTKEEFLALTSLPQLPNHDELKDAEWNWSLNGAKERVRVYGKMLIGASYNIIEEGIIYYVKVYEASSSVDQVSIKYSGDGGAIIIDWGDGNTIRYTDTGNNNSAKHHYEISGNFKIKITTESTTVGSRNISINTYGGYAYLNKCVFNDNYLVPYSSNSNYNPSVIFYGKNSFYLSGINLIGIVDIILIAKEISGEYQDNYLYASNNSCRFCVVIPNNVIRTIKVKNCNIICLPETVQTGGTLTLEKITGRLPICCPNIVINNSSSNDWYLESAIQVQLPPTENISANIRLTCYNRTLIIPEGVVTITSNLGNINNSFTIILPSTITTYTPISAASAFYVYCYATIPPTINGFSGILISIYVPAESVEDYKGATNWSAYADKIFAIPTE